MAKKSTPYFAFYTDDWHGGTKHLSLEEKACYLELVLYQHANGVIPTEPLIRMNLCGIVDVGKWERIWRHIGDKFPVIDDDGNRANPRMTAERDKAIDHHQKCIDNGRKGGRPSINKPIGYPMGSAGETRGVPQTKPNQNQNSYSASASADDARFSLEPDDFSLSKNGAKIDLCAKKTPKTDFWLIEFDKFWAVVHWKKAKVTARKAFIAAVRRVAKERQITLQQASDMIIGAMAEYAESAEGQTTERTKTYPASWLNGGQYDDDPATWQSTTGKERITF